MGAMNIYESMVKTIWHVTGDFSEWLHKDIGIHLIKFESGGDLFEVPFGENLRSWHFFDG